MNAKVGRILLLLQNTDPGSAGHCKGGPVLLSCIPIQINSFDKVALTKCTMNSDHVNSDTKQQ